MHPENQIFTFLIKYKYKDWFIISSILNFKKQTVVKIKKKTYTAKTVVLTGVHIGPHQGILHGC